MVRFLTKYIVHILLFIIGFMVLLSADFERKPVLVDCPTVEVRADPRVYSFEDLEKSQAYGHEFIVLRNQELEQGTGLTEANYSAREKVAIDFGFKDEFSAYHYNVSNNELRSKANLYRLCKFNWSDYYQKGDTMITLDFFYLKNAVEEFEIRMHKLTERCIKINMDESEPMFANSIKRMCRKEALAKLGVINETS